jgi:hypothetical protein
MLKMENNSPDRNGKSQQKLLEINSTSENSRNLTIKKEVENGSFNDNETERSHISRKSMISSRSKRSKLSKSGPLKIDLSKNLLKAQLKI